MDLVLHGHKGTNGLGSLREKRREEENRRGKKAGLLGWACKLEC